MTEGEGIAVVFDCGATNVRVIAMNERAEILSAQAVPNETSEDPFFPGGRIWDVDAIWTKLCKASRKVIESVDQRRIVGVTVATFGVDGTVVDETGRELYPVISWQCQRTRPLMERVGEYLPVGTLYRRSGVYPYAFNTINKIIWLKQSRPELLERAHRFLFMSSLLVFRLTGVLRNDTTMAGTSMMMDIRQRTFSREILGALEVPDALFGPLAEPGQRAGEIHRKAAEETGLPEGMVVFFGGHDTQMALIGAGASSDQPVLNSGTWEILMVRSQEFQSTPREMKAELTTEADAVPGFYDIGQNWLGSGILEWFLAHFYPQMQGRARYEAMVQEAGAITPGSQGLQISPTFFKDVAHDQGGVISGLTTRTTRGQIGLALLESLAFRLREGLVVLQKAGGFRAERILCSGGGSKNALWNQIRADVCQIPLCPVGQKETTVLGASLLLFVSAGIFSSLQEAQARVRRERETFVPSGRVPTYQTLYQQYQRWKTDSGVMFHEK